MGDGGNSNVTPLAPIPTKDRPDALRRLRGPVWPSGTKLERSQSSRRPNGTSFSIRAIVESIASEKNQSTPQNSRKLGRAESFNIKCSTNTNSETVLSDSGSSSGTGLLRTGSISRTLPQAFANLRAKYQGASLDQPGVTSRNYGTRFYVNSRLTLEQEIEEFLTMLPSVIQKKKSYQVNDFNWVRSYSKVQEEANNISLSVQAYQIVKRFHARLATAVANFKTINKILIDAKIPTRENLESEASNICMEMNVVRVGFRGRATPNISWIPYISEVFQHEMCKVQKIDYKRNKVLTNASEIEKRTAAVKWIMAATKFFKYASETAHIAVNILDAYMCLQNTKLRMGKKSWFLFAATAFLIAVKFEEPNVLIIPKLAEIVLEDVGVVLKPADLKAAEADVLTALELNIFPPIAPNIAFMIIVGGGLIFPSVNMRKLVLDLTLGILFRTLLDPGRVRISPTDQAKAALETAVEYVFYHYEVCSKRDLSSYQVFANSVPGMSIGEFALSMCHTAYQQRFTSYKIPSVSLAVASYNLSPARNIKA